jgi:1-acyl-sn-glycerol-3-phosphate acyltransferase
VPDHGPALIISNHSGQIPLDGGMITIACIIEKEHPRMCRAMIEKWFPTLPYLGAGLTRVGQVVGVTENAEQLLAAGKLMMIFPEGIKGSGKTWDKRYQLQRFTLGFMELAIKFRCPIIPTAVIGGEEQAPTFKNVEWLAQALNMPYFPLTPTFPWLGLAGVMPLPSKYRIYFGEPMDFSDRQDDLSDPDLVRNHVEAVKSRIQEMVNQGLEERPFPGL